MSAGQCGQFCVNRLVQRLDGPRHRVIIIPDVVSRGEAKPVTALHEVIPARLTPGVSSATIRRGLLSFRAASRASRYLRAAREVANTDDQSSAHSDSGQGVDHRRGVHGGGSRRTPNALGPSQVQSRRRRRVDRCGGHRSKWRARSRPDRRGFRSLPGRPSARSRRQPPGPSSRVRSRPPRQRRRRERRRRRSRASRCGGRWFCWSMIWDSQSKA